MAESAGDLYVTAKIDASDLSADLARQTTKQAKDSGVTIGGLVGKGLKIGAGAAATGIAAVLTGAFVKGFSRLTSIDTAKAKLTGLGYTGKTLQGIMDTALASVKGTAYGLDEAVSAVPGLLAAGVKPGQALEQALKNMGSAATLSGSSFMELSDVFGDSAAKGHLTTDTLNRMAERGIPALQLVAKHLGVTQEAVADMATAGTIDFQTFQDALTEGIGPAALAAGDSFQGMMANVMAALGRLGADVLGPLFEGIKQVMPGVMAAFDGLAGAMKPIVADIAPALGEAFKKIAGWLASIDWGAVGKTIHDVWGGLVDIFDAVRDAVGRLIDRFQPGLTSNLGKVKDAIMAIDWDQVKDAVIKITTAFVDWAPAVAAVAGAFVAMKVVKSIVGTIETMGTVIKGVKTAMAAYRTGLALTTALTAGLEVAFGAETAAVWAANFAFLASPITWIVVGIIALIAAIVLLALNWDKVTKFLTDVWAGFVDWFTGVMDGFLGWWNGIWEGITKFVTEAIDNVIKWVQANWGLLLSLLIGPIGLAIQWIVDNWAQIAQFFIDVWNNVVAFFQPAVDAIANIFRVLGETLANIWLVIRAVFKVAWDAIVSAVTPVVTALVDFFTTVFTEVGNFFRDTWNAISDFFGAVWEGIVAIVQPQVQFIVDVITNAVNLIKDVWNNVWGAIQDYFARVWLGMQIIFGPIINTIKTVIQNTLSTISGIWNSVWGGIKSFFQDIWDGIKRALDTAIGTVVAVFNGLKDKILAPLAGAANWLYNVGKDLIQGMINGIKGMVNNIKNAISDTVNGVINWAKGILGEHSPSKVFDQIGTDLGKGFVNGINGMANDVQESVGAMTAGAVNVAGATITAMPGGGTAAPTSTDNSKTFTIEPGAFQLSGPDPYAVSLATVNRIAERVGI